MPAIEEVPIKSNLATKLIIAIVVGFVFLAGLIFALARYYQVTGRTAFEIANETRQYNQNLAAVQAEYRQKFKSLINQYLDRLDDQQLTSQANLAASQELHDQLLDLTVPAVYTDYHLSAVLLMNRIMTKIEEQAVEEVRANLEQLEDLISQF